MTSVTEIIHSVFKNQQQSLGNLESVHKEGIERVVHVLSSIEGKIIVAGVGKSAIVAQKMSATLNSLGAHALFLHTGDALHGDMGVLQKSDILFLISKSGNSSELLTIAKYARERAVDVILLHSNNHALVLQYCTHDVYVPVNREADMNNLAPTNSTLLHLAVADAIAICLQYNHAFDKEKFAQIHPEGTLGKLLKMKVSDVIDKHIKPEVSANADLKEIIYEISSKRLGACCVVSDGKISGIITDGDIRRLLEKTTDLSVVKAQDFMTTNPKTIYDDALLKDSLAIMRSFNISQLVVSDISNNYLGVIHLHQVLDQGIY